MKTDDLIAALAEGAGPVAPARPLRRCALAAMAGAVVAAAILVVWLGMRPMGEAVRKPSFWMKAASLHLPRPVSGSGVRLAVKLVPHGPAQAVKVAPIDPIHGPAGSAGAGGITICCGWPESLVDRPSTLSEAPSTTTPSSARMRDMRLSTSPLRFGSK